MPTNDSALLKGKNAAVVRKYLGYAHIPKRSAPQVNAFTQDVLSPFLNYHHPRLFPSDTTDAGGCCSCLAFSLVREEPVPWKVLPPRFITMIVLLEKSSYSTRCLQLLG